MSEITIVEYSPKLASPVAVMWNNSTEGWNGADFSTTKENVISKENASVYLNLFLAVDTKTINDPEPKVVGYCKLTRDSHDINALYIAHLSVIPEYFNKKVGKALVLRSVERTIELKYPRLYLYTWSGNTRAVPLYKKCGFFWEQNEEVHLVNMIPSVINCEAVSDFFKTACWYDDSKRVIEIVPDGRVENKFEYYTYLWEKDGKKLSMEYCQKGKGLRKIDCDDYSITATVCGRDLIFGKKHQISYEIINKSGKPLNIELDGSDDKNIKFSYQFKGQVLTTQTLSAEFMVDPIEKPQADNEIHPTVFTKIKINGKAAEFRTGIVPKHPADITMGDVKAFYYESEEGTAYINLVSSCEESCTAYFELCENENISFEQRKFSINLKSLEKKSVPVKFKIIHGFLYNIKAEITVRLENGTEIKYPKEIYKRFATHNTDGFTENEAAFEMYLGKYRLSVLKKAWSCGTLFVDQERRDQNINNHAPRFGKPYSSEFDRQPAQKVVSYKENNTAVLKADYVSKDFAGLSVSVFYRLYPHGILEKWLEITNGRDSVLNEEFYFSEKFNPYRTNMIIPYENKIIKIQNDFEDDLSCYDCSKITENWIFSGNESKGTAGVTWPKEYKIRMMEWCFGFEHSLNGLKPGETKITKPVTFFLNTFNLEDFRKFVAKNNALEPVDTVKTSEVIINGGNPFVKEDLKIELIDCKVQPLKADLSISSKSGLFSEQKVSSAKEDDLHSLSMNIPVRSEKSIEEITCNVRYTSQQLIFNKILFPVSSETVKMNKSEEHGKTVFTVDNGAVCFKASPDFAPTLYSLVYNGNEWVDSSFPQTISKAWWTPWYGGLTLFLEGISEKELLEENTSAEFVTITDNFKNGWHGIKITVNIDKKEKFKGISFEQYFLTMPGSPLTVNFNRVINRTGRLIETDYYKLPFLKAGNDIKKTYWEYFNNNDELCRFYIGYECVNISVDSKKIHTLNSDELSDKMLFFTSGAPYDIQVCANETTTPKVVVELIRLADKESFTSGNEFMIFSNKNMDYKELSDLRNIKFNIS